MRGASAHRRRGCGKRSGPTPCDLPRIYRISFRSNLCGLPLLAESRIGYQNLCRLITQFKLRETTKAEGAALVADVEEYGKGLVCLTGGSEGPLAAALAQRRLRRRTREPSRRWCISSVPRNVYVELQRHFDREEEHRNRAAIRIARSLNLPLLATGGVNYAHSV